MIADSHMIWFDRIFAVQSDTSIKRQALQNECDGPVACSGLQSPVLQRTFRKITSPEQAP